jgi:hypothetical protein
MLRKIAIGLAAAAIAMGGLTLNASAIRGGGGPHGGGFARVGGGYGPHGGFAMRGDRFRHQQWGWRGGGGSYSGYSYGGSCWRWTPEGRVWVCGGGYGYGPSYGYQGWRYHRGGRVFGMHGRGRRFR